MSFIAGQGKPASLEALSVASGCAIGRKASSVIAGWRTISGRGRTCSWISGARRSRPMTWATRARVTPSWRAMAAWLEASPDFDSGLPLDGLAEQSPMRMAKRRESPVGC